MSRFTARVVVTFGLLAGLSSLRAAQSSASPPHLLRDIDPRTLSSGLYAALVESGYHGGLLASRRTAAAVAAPAKGTHAPVLDARVGDNIFLGADPAALGGQRGQAEPHLWRSATNPELLVAAFQDGRYASGGGAVGCGYGVSTDGGLTWTRALIPGLTTASGGTYVRATDPVAAVDLDGNIFLNTLAARQSAFADGGVVVVSRSTNGGATFGSPVVVAAGSNTHSLDKNWMAVNDYPGAPNANRLAVTYTDLYISGSSYAYDLWCSVSDDRGATWSTPVLIRPRNSLVNQATQPFFLPDGSLLVPYITNYNNGTFRIECQRSTDGGRTFGSSPVTVVSSVREWADPVLRAGSFLITAWVARESGSAFITYVGRDANFYPRVFVTKSANNGATWSTPVAASDEQGFTSVLNPAVTATPDGQRVSVIYYDKRHSDESGNYVDLYSNTSFDGGASWGVGIRLTEYSSDVRYAPLTGSGYMLGDYQGLVPPLNANQPAVALTVDTRTGDPDPLAIRFAQSATPTYDAWRVAQFSGAEAANVSISRATADADGDGLINLLEYALATRPRLAASGTPYFFTSHQLQASVYHNFRGNDVTLSWETSTDGSTWTSLAFTSPLEEMPTVDPYAVRLVGGTFVFADATPRLLREIFTLGTTRRSGEILPVNSDSRLVNLSARARVGTGDNVLIAGFVTTGGSKNLLIRGVGPTLASYGVASYLADPQLYLSAFGSSVFTPLQNDNWDSASAVSAPLFSSLGAFDFQTGSLDSALLATLAARPYTVVLSGTNQGAGVGLAEIYDADATPSAPSASRLVNLSARGVVGSGNDVLIGGFVITGTLPRRVLIRAVGPGLSGYGLGSATLADPVLWLFSSNAIPGSPIAISDDWQLSPNPTALAESASRVGAFALAAGSLDSALLLTLAPGIYTAQVSGYSGATGLALVEIYDAD